MDSRRATAPIATQRLSRNRNVARAVRIDDRRAIHAGSVMKPWIWLRIAAALQALGTVGHNLATLSTKATHGPQEQAVFDAMKSFTFVIMGSVRSTWDFYRGYQFATTVNFLTLLALMLLLASMSRIAPRQSRPLV